MPDLKKQFTELTQAPATVIYAVSRMVALGLRDELIAYAEKGIAEGTYEWWDCVVACINYYTLLDTLINEEQERRDDSEEFDFTLLEELE